MWYPYGTYAALAANIVLILFQGYTAFLNPFSASKSVVNYILLSVFVILFVAYKFLKGTSGLSWRGGYLDGAKGGGS